MRWCRQPEATGVHGCLPNLMCSSLHIDLAGSLSSSSSLIGGYSGICRTLFSVRPDKMCELKKETTGCTHWSYSPDRGRIFTSLHLDNHVQMRIEDPCVLEITSNAPSSTAG